MLGLVGGPLAAAVCFLILPSDYVNTANEATSFSIAGRITLSLLVWMGIWWLTEAVDLAATALLPLVVLPLGGAADIKAAAAPYASDIVFLIMGGFILALAMQRWGLDRRIALMTLRLVGDKPANLVGGVMLAIALMGGFVSNTAKAAMLLPVGVSLIEFVRGRLPAANDPAAKKQIDNFAVCMMLGIAYACSISGVSTIIGTPPNAYLAGFIRDDIAAPYRGEISFLTWLWIGVPLTVVFLPLVWLLLTRVLFPIGGKPTINGKDFIQKSYADLGPMSRGEWATFIVFMATVLAWVCRQPLTKIEIGHAPHLWRPFAGLTDSVIAMTGALILFVIPSGDRNDALVMDWKTAVKLPWGVLILFGGGLSLAAAIEANGVAEFLAAQGDSLSGMPPLVLLIAVTTLVVFLSEIGSNTATATTMVPILAGMAPGLNVHPYFLIVPATLAASLAFMMPAGTPPNAIVFGTGYVSMRQMCWAGFGMNLLGVVLIVLSAYWIVPAVLSFK